MGRSPQIAKSLRPVVYRTHAKNKNRPKPRSKGCVGGYQKLSQALWTPNQKLWTGESARVRSRARSSGAFKLSAFPPLGNKADLAGLQWRWARELIRKLYLVETNSHKRSDGVEIRGFLKVSIVELKQTAQLALIELVRDFHV
jgi:hypothetical protein